MRLVAALLTRVYVFPVDETRTGSSWM